MKIKFYATLRTIVGGNQVDLHLPDGATVQQLLDELIRRYPAMKMELLNEGGELYSHVHLLVNGRDAPYLEKGMDTILDPEDLIAVFPAVGGG